MPNPMRITKSMKNAMLPTSLVCIWAKASPISSAFIPLNPPVSILKKYKSIHPPMTV